MSWQQYYTPIGGVLVSALVGAIPVIILAAMTMQILERQLLHPRWIQYGSRLLDSVKEESAATGQEILDAVFSDSREAVVRKVATGTLTAPTLLAHDFVYDLV